MTDLIVAKTMGFTAHVKKMGRGDYGREICSYIVKTPTNVYFKGEGFSPSPFHKFDSPMGVVELLFWICQTPDSGMEFSDYSPAQMDWAKSPQCDELGSIFGDEDLLRGEDDGGEPSRAGDGIDWTIHWESGDIGDKREDILIITINHLEPSYQWGAEPSRV